MKLMHEAKVCNGYPIATVNVKQWHVFYRNTYMKTNVCNLQFYVI